MTKRITLVDYGMANMLNVARAFQHCGADISIATKPSEMADAECLVVPGVGAFADSIREVQARGFDDAIRNFVGTGRPLLGICVGMQLLFDASEEFGEHAGLSILPGHVRAIPRTTTDGADLRVPHIGWNALRAPAGRNWQGTLLAPFEGRESAVYFVHSFAAQPALELDRLADFEYGGHRLCAAVQRDNVMATQFHPERSGETGLDLIRHFISM